MSYSSFFKSKRQNSLLLKVYLFLWIIFFSYLLNNGNLVIDLKKDFWIVIIMNIPIMLSYHFMNYLNDKAYFKRVFGMENMAWNIAGLLVVGFVVYDLVV